MKPEYEKIIEQAEHSFTARVVNRNSRPLLSQAWHYHPEIEICYTVKSNGRRFVGNQIDDYQEGDLVLLGSNLPHGFTTETYCSQIVIQLMSNFMGDAFFLKPELRPIAALFERAKQGIAFTDKTKPKALRLMRKILVTEGLPKLMHLLALLQLLAESPQHVLICSKTYAIEFNETQLGRIKIVYDHIMQNYTRDVNIKEVADKLNISEAAFYKFIKKQTQKTYTQIINEFRINYAGKLLMNTAKTVGEICHECGFNNVSYFNRKFKQIMQRTPENFRRQYINQPIN
jgi:AraC-like DNA-binding protein